MNIAGKFEKVSPSRFRSDWADTFAGESAEKIQKIYEEIRMPVRATVGSAGYDFYSPLDFVLTPGQTIKIPTGIRARIEDGWVLMIFPRSGLGFKYRIRLDNTVGVIDSDYYGSDNEGHIFIKITNDSNEGRTLSLKKGDGFAQGVFLPYGVTSNDETAAVRNGGFGSTG
ncbi:MAG TPA: deoxyuridine 5'-triphosphate nucleotidohydrolase [Lachnospiraceae bacterium]|nr:deoxyuridine 5'-triphosphate nucleotidohydrolase [Lachnospiraceae bacterium]